MGYNQTLEKVTDIYYFQNLLLLNKTVGVAEIYV